MDEARAQMAAAGHANRAERERSLARLSKERLLKTIETKLRTSFVCPLAQIEAAFGRLWGDKKHPAEMSDRERAWWEAYQEARNHILTNGNNQLRALKSELSLYSVTYQGHQRTLTVKEGEES